MSAVHGAAKGAGAAKWAIAIYPGVLERLNGPLLFTPGFWIIWERVGVISFKPSQGGCPDRRVRLPEGTALT
jgi:hypothetical protein